VNCPLCGERTRITHTRERLGGTRRRRVCNRCKFTGWTSEQFEDQDVREAAVLRRELARVHEATNDAVHATNGTKRP